MWDGMSTEPLEYLLDRWLAGDQQAATTLCHRHAARLFGMVRKNLSAELARECDPEDVVQSAYMKFFAAARSRTLELETSDDIWRLLVAITRNLIRDQYKRQQALKRKSDAVEDPASNLADLQDLQSMPGEPAALSDELKRLFGAFKPTYQRAIALRMEGWKVEEIAQETRHSERTVRRVLKRVQEYLRQRCKEMWD
jgi:RNA polymerase sigma factor (sigma-70 family)